MVGFLTSASLYWDAVTLCQTFSLPVTSLTLVTEGLAARCVKLGSDRGAELEQAWTWLTENRPAGAEISGGGGLAAPRAPGGGLG